MPFVLSLGVLLLAHAGLAGDAAAAAALPAALPAAQAPGVCLHAMCGWHHTRAPCHAAAVHNAAAKLQQAGGASAFKTSTLVSCRPLPARGAAGLHAAS